MLQHLPALEMVYEFLPKEFITWSNVEITGVSSDACQFHFRGNHCLSLRNALNGKKKAYHHPTPFCGLRWDLNSPWLLRWLARCDQSSRSISERRRRELKSVAVTEVSLKYQQVERDRDLLESSLPVSSSLSLSLSLSLSIKIIERVEKAEF